MPTVKISVEAMSLLIPEAKSLGATVKDVLDSIVIEYFREEEEEPEETEGPEE